jgi:hypothetical protein
MEAVNKALELEKISQDETIEATKVAFDVNVGSGAVIGGLVGAAVGKGAAEQRADSKYKQIYGNSVAKVVNEHNQKLIDMSNDHYTQVKNIEKDLKILFTPVTVVFILKNTVIDTINTDTMNSSMKDAWKRKDSTYFKNYLINKIYLDAFEAEQMFIRRLIEQDKQLRGAIAKKASFIPYVEDVPDMHLYEVLEGVKYFDNLFKKAEYSGTLSKYANALIESTAEWNSADIPVELGSMRYPGDTDFDLGLNKLAFLWFGRDPMDMESLSPRYLKKHMSVVYLPDRVLYVTDNVVVSQRNVLDMGEDDFGRFKEKDSKFFKHQFFELAKKAGFDDNSVEDAFLDKEAEESEGILEDSFYSDTHEAGVDGSVTDLLKRAVMIGYKTNGHPLKTPLNESVEKVASPDDFLLGKDGKIPILENSFKAGPAKDVAYMIATSHEYKTPNVKAALSFTKNYDWEIATARVANLQGIDKPIIQEKVKAIADNINPKKLKPLVVVNQLNGVRPQTPGKKILVDGHHRIEAYKYLGITETSVYKGTYTGNAEKSFKELQEKNASVADVNPFYKELFTKGGIHPKVYYMLLMDEFNNEWLTWDNEILLETIKNTFGVTEISPLVSNKLMSIVLVIHSDSGFTGYHTFEKVVRAFNDKPINWEVRESNISLAEFVNAMRTMSDLIADNDDNLYDNFSEHVLGYLIEVLMERGYRVCAHKTFSKNEQTFWDLVNLELLENWIKALPSSLVNADTDTAKLEAKGVQRITKEICDGYRGKPLDINSIMGAAKQKVSDFGFKDSVFSDVVVDNVVNSLTVDLYLADVEKRKEDQLKNYLKK